MNSLLYKIPDYQLDRLQMVLNNTARLIKQIKKSSPHHITDILYELHLLPIEQRIKYKILLLMFKCHIKEAPKLSLSICHLNTLSKFKSFIKTELFKEAYGDV